MRLVSLYTISLPDHNLSTLLKSGIVVSLLFSNMGAIICLLIRSPISDFPRNSSISLKLEPSYREAISLTRNEYENTESLFFNNETLDQIMEKKDFVDESLYVFEINRKMHMN